METKHPIRHLTIISIPTGFRVQWQEAGRLEEREFNNFNAALTYRTQLENEQIKLAAARRAALETPLERILFDNDPANGPLIVRVGAMLSDEVHNETTAA